jgi:hypothetical protein
MTTTTDVGLEAISDVLIGNRTGQINALAIGTGTGTESAGATSLGSEVFRAGAADSNVELIETGSAGETELILRVKGGTDVSAGTAITEVAAFIDGAGGGGELVVIDNFADVIIETGHTEEFTIPFTPLRSL